MKYIFRFLASLFLVSAFAAPVHGATIRVPAGGDMQAAIDAAQPGDVLVLQAGATYPVTELTLPAKPFGPVITIRSSATLPGRTITDFDKPLLATLESGQDRVEAVLVYAGAVNWRFEGIDFKMKEGCLNREAVSIQDGASIAFDQINIDAPVTGLKRGIRLNGRNLTVTRSRIVGVWAPGQDSQALAGWDNSIGITIADNTLEAASENIMFGGADSAAPDRVPADILVERNYLYKRLEWRAEGSIGRVVKNLFELKAGKRVVVRDNLMVGNWADGQSGRGVLFTPRNQDGTAPWSIIEDVLFERNIIRETDYGFFISGFDNNYVSGQTNRIVIRDNELETKYGLAFSIVNESNRLEIYRNKVRSATPDSVLVTFDGGHVMPSPSGPYQTQWAVLDLVFADNDVTSDQWIHSPTVNGPGAFAAWAKDYSLVSPTTPPAVEICGNNQDDDGDGQVDEGCTVAPPPPPPPDPLLSDRQRVDAAIASLQPLETKLTGKALTNLKNILTRLRTLQGQVR